MKPDSLPDGSHLGVVRPASLPLGARASLSYRAFVVLIVALIVLAIVMLVLREARLAVVSPSFLYDEAWSVSTSSQSFSLAWHIATNDNHPPLYPLFLWVWFQLFPASEFWARLPAFLFALASIGMMLRLRHRLPLAAVLIATYLLAINPHFVVMAGLARGYALMVLLSVMGLVYAVERRLLPLIISCVLLGLTHFYGTLLASLYLGFEFLQRRDIASRICCVGAQLLITAFPLYHVLAGHGTNAVGGGFWLQHTPAQAVIDAMNAFLALPTKTPNAISYLVGSADSMLFVAGVALFYLLVGWLMWRSIVFFARSNNGIAAFDRKLCWLMLAQIFLFVLVVMLLSLHTPISLQRYFVVLVPAGAVLVGYALLPLTRVSLRLTLGLLAMMLIMLGTSVIHQREEDDWLFDDSKSHRAFVAELADRVRSSGGALYFMTSPNHYEPRLGQFNAYAYYLPDDVAMQFLDYGRMNELAAGDMLLRPAGLCLPSAGGGGRDGWRGMAATLGAASIDVRWLGLSRGGEDEWCSHSYGVVQAGGAR